MTKTEVRSLMESAVRVSSREYQNDSEDVGAGQGGGGVKERKKRLSRAKRQGIWVRRGKYLLAEWLSVSRACSGAVAMTHLLTQT